MKFLALALGALGLSGVSFGQGSTTIVHTVSQVEVSVPTQQLVPATTTPPDVPYTTVTNCWSTTGTSACRTETKVCPVGSTTTLQTWVSKGCNWADMTLTPQPSLKCSIDFSTYMACLPTGSMPPFPSMPTRSQRLVAKHAQAASTITGAPLRSTLQSPVATWTSNNMGGSRSQRLVAQYTSKDLGGRSQRWVAREAVRTTSAEMEIPEKVFTREMGIPCGEIFPCPGATTLLGPDPEITAVITDDAPAPTTLETVRKA